MGMNMVKRKAPPDPDPTDDKIEHFQDVKYKKMEIEGPNYYLDNGNGYFGMIALPDEIQEKIFKRLRKEVLRNLRLTCKTIKESVDRLGAILVISFFKSPTETPEIFEDSFRKIASQWNDPPKGLAFRATKIDSLLPLFPEHLLHLNLANCLQITDEIIAKLPRNIRFLNLNNCTNISNEGLRFLPPNLKYLHLGNLVQITSKGIQYLPKTLVQLNLYGCSNITDDSMLQLPQNLSYLNIRFCYRLTSEAMKAISQSCNVERTKFADE